MFLNLITIMATNLRIEDKLDGAINFSQWKARIVLILQDSELWDIVNNTTTNPMTIRIDATSKAAFDKRDIKSKKMLLDAIKDHVTPHISGKYHAH